MSPATSWTELEMTWATFYLSGFPIAGSWEDDAFVDFLFEIPSASGYLFNPHTPWSQLSVAATSGTELTTPATTWTELT